MLRSAVFAVLLCGLVAGPAAVSAETTSFDFKDPKGVNGVSFVVDSKLEPIVGMIGGVQGSVDYDPQDPESFSGHISLPASGIAMVNERMTSVLMGDGWLNADDNMKLTFHFDKVTNVEKKEDDRLLTVEGRLTVGKLELPKTVDISVTHLPDAAAERGGAEAGDLLVLRSMFKVDRTDLGLKPEMSDEKVGSSIGVFVPIVGYSQ